MAAPSSRLAYFDCPAGASGDMILGALVDAGWPIARLNAVVEALGLAQAVRVRAEPVLRGPLAATRVHVEAVEPDPPQRHLGDIVQLILASPLPEPVRELATLVFTRLAEAEAAVHGSTVETVHFHEVGALDAIVDIVGAVAGLAELGVDAVYCSPLPAGSGWTNSQHGFLPLPAPATLALLAAANAPIAASPKAVDLVGELVTPTGAALLATLASFSRPPLRLERIGHGAGGRDTPWPNVLRLWLGNPTTPLGATIPGADSDEVVLVETNIDDMVPEHYGHVCERLFELGALDVWLVPVQMKKGRPGTVLSVLAPLELEGAVAELLLTETTTFGVRVQPARRHIALREIVTVETPYGPIPVKVKRLGDRVLGHAPEYEACRAAARSHGVALAQVYAAVAGTVLD
jgi:hypothetical protein